MNAGAVFKKMGSDFLKATGAHDLVVKGNGFQFDIPGRGFAKQSINRIEVTLDPYDTYTMRFYRGRRSTKFGFQLRLVEERMNVKEAELAGTFQEVTGLKTGA